jgi:trk system potassium uptake protein
MYVVIVGAGEVGSHVARTLIEEGHDVAVIENDDELARRLDATLDALVIHGSGVSPAVLQRAGVRRADLLLAVTSTDEVNLIACMTGRKYGGPRLRTVARVRQSPDVVGDLALSAEDLGLDALISPEAAMTTAALEDLRFAGSGEMRELAGGKVVLVGMDLAPDSPLVHETIAELRADFPEDFVVVGVQGKNGRIPTGSDRLEPDDRAFVLAKPEHLTELAILSGQPWYHARHTMIIGCGNTGLALARALEKQGLKPLIIEKDRDRAELVATLLPQSLVLQGDGADPELLQSQIEDAKIDALVVLLKDPEKSVLIGVFATSLGVAKVVARCDKPAYTHLANRLGVDAVISPKQAMTDAIHRYVRSGKVELTLTLGAQQAEIVHFTIPEAPRRADVIRKPLSELGLPDKSLIGALIRGDEVTLAPQSEVLRPGDELLVISDLEGLARIEKMLS